MTRALSILAFAGIALWVLALGRRPGTQVPTLGELLGLAMASTAGRALTTASWAWVGWHFFGR
jgi:uncharacterized protein DUF6186